MHFCVKYNIFKSNDLPSTIYWEIFTVVSNRENYMHENVFNNKIKTAPRLRYAKFHTC